MKIKDLLKKYSSDKIYLDLDREKFLPILLSSCILDEDELDQEITLDAEFMSCDGYQSKDCLVKQYKVKNKKVYLTIVE